MELITYKTNIRSEAALGKVAPYLNRAIGTANWQLDLYNKDKKLTVYSPGIVNETVVLDAVHKAGFEAVNLEDFYAIY